MEITEILKKLRKEKGLSQEEFAKMINISRGAYAKYETGENTPPIDNLKKIAEFYNCSIDYLTGRYN